MNILTNISDSLSNASEQLNISAPSSQQLEINNSQMIKRNIIRSVIVLAVLGFIIFLAYKNKK